MIKPEAMMEVARGGSMPGRTWASWVPLVGQPQDIVDTADSMLVIFRGVGISFESAA